MNARLQRILRIGAIFAAVFGFLYVRFSMGLFRENEATRVVHYAMFAVGSLLGFGAWAFEMTGGASLPRRDSLWGISGGVLSYALLRLIGLV